MELHVHVCMYKLEVILFRRFLSLIDAELALILIIAFFVTSKDAKVVCLLITISHFVIFLFTFFIHLEVFG